MDSVDFATFTTSPAKFTYLLTFAVLAASTFLTVLEVVYMKRSDRNPSTSYLASALMTESGVNVVAGFFYYLFIQLSFSNKNPNAAVIASLRSLDWLITTPLMLASLMYYFMFYDTGTDCKLLQTCNVVQLKRDDSGVDLSKHPWDTTLIILLDIVMITLGSTWFDSATIPRFALSCGCFGVMVWLMYRSFYKPSKTRNKDFMALFFLLTWAGYPLVRLIDISQGSYNTEAAYNVLDLLSKGGFGIIIWVMLQNLQGECKNTCI